MVEIPNDAKIYDYVATVIEEGIIREVHKKYSGRRFEEIPMDTVNLEVRDALRQFMEAFDVGGGIPLVRVSFNYNNIAIDIRDPNDGDLIRPYQWAVKLLRGQYG